MNLLQATFHICEAGSSIGFGSQQLFVHIFQNGDHFRRITREPETESGTLLVESLPKRAIELITKPDNAGAGDNKGGSVEADLGSEDKAGLSLSVSGEESVSKSKKVRGNKEV